jgi:type I restriction enzyme S subunit
LFESIETKIELNRKMNETLEAMARALFKSWFVDFDSIRAKAEGRLPAGRQATPASPKPGSWCVYALECEDGSIYIGHTQNLDRRYEEHAGGKGAEWTKRHPPLRIAYWEGLPSQAAAVAREKTLKTGSGREWLKAEIAHQGLATGGLPAHLAALFPDSFEDTELGEIPFGWTVLCLDETARFLNGLALQKFPPKGDRFLPVIKISQLHAGDMTGADKASADLAPEYVVEDGDVLFSWSGSLECVLWAGGRGALNQHLFKVASEKFPKWFYFLWIHWHLEDFRHIAAGKATTMGHIQRHHLTNAKVLVSPPELLHAMSGFMQPIIESIWRRKVQSRTLTALRDMLLPKLISGELRVPEAAGLTSVPGMR